MKLNVEKSFVDRITGELHKIGDVIEVEKTRGEELLADTRKLVSLNDAENSADETKPTAKKANTTKKK